MDTKMFDKFPILAFPAGEFNERDVEEVKLWKEIGLTFNFTNLWDETKHEKSGLLRLLDECERHGIKMIIQDARLHWKGASADPEGYRKRYKAAYDDFGKHPATMGFMVGDEPTYDQMGDVFTAIRIQREEAPELLPYTNLLPLGGKAPYWKTFESIKDVTSFFEGSYNAPILSYDRYSQMNGTDYGTDLYFHDLRVFRDIANSLGIPLWTCLLTIGHWSFSAPDEAAVRWQFNTALASGCNGIIWFTLNDIPFVTNTYGAAIDVFGEKTQYFGNIKNVARYFLASFADIFKDLKLDKCYHVGHAYGGYPLFKEGDSDIVLSVESLKDTDLILSFYTHENGDKYVSVVNNSKTVNDHRFNLTFNAEKCDPYEIKGFGNSVRVFDTYSNRATNNDIPDRGRRADDIIEKRYTINLWATAGQMYLYKI